MLQTVMFELNAICPDGEVGANTGQLKQVKKVMKGSDGLVNGSLDMLVYLKQVIYADESRGR